MSNSMLQFPAIRVGSAALGLVVAAFVGGCAGSPADAPEVVALPGSAESSSVGSAVQDIEVAHFPLPDDIASIAKQARNDDVVIAKVVRIGEARWTTPDGQVPPEFTDPGTRPQRPNFIFTPVEVVIEEAIHGKVRAGDTITVRSISGTVGPYRFSNHESPSAETYVPGESVLLFLSDFVDAGDGLHAATPNFVFVIKGDAAELWNGKYRLGLKSIKERVKTEVAKMR